MSSGQVSGSSVLSFDPLRTSDGGQYTCTVTVGECDTQSVTREKLTQLIVASKYILIHCILFSFTLTFPVPQPTTVITTTATDIVYVGDTISLTCTVTLDSNIDSIVSVMIIWSGPVNINRHEISETTISGNDYTNSLNINQLTERDQGTYTCLANVTGDYIVPTTGQGTYTLSKLRKTIAIVE